METDLCELTLQVGKQVQSGVTGQQKVLIQEITCVSLCQEATVGLQFTVGITNNT